MIYLIGGVPRGGKSILARRLSKALNVPYISTDNLRFVVLPYCKGKAKDKYFPFIQMLHLPAIDDFFHLYTGNEMLRADIQEARSIWSGLKSLLDHLLLCKMDYIIEGVHLLPSLVKQYKDNKNVKIIFLVKFNVAKIYHGLIRNKNNGDWIASNTKNKNVILKSAKTLCNYGHYFQGDIEKYNFKCFNTEHHFFDKINRAVTYLRT